MSGWYGSCTAVPENTGVRQYTATTTGRDYVQRIEGVLVLVEKTLAHRMPPVTIDIVCRIIGTEVLAGRLRFSIANGREDRPPAEAKLRRIL